MKGDIKTREDITLLITSFYDKVKTDETIGFIFTRIVNMNWEQHVPVIVDFWETILLDNPVYQKNAMEVHYDLNKKFPLQPEHFNAWLSLFDTTVDELFEGAIATLAKTKAKSIGGLMQFKIMNRNNKKSLL